jgi:hypothetical protein
MTAARRTANGTTHCLTSGIHQGEPGQAPHRLEVSARRKLRVQMVETSTVEILQLLDDIRAHIEKFIALDAAIKAELATAREKPK